MITDEISIRPRYGEVDQMGYVYHANYVNFCHQARTELFRKYGINDSILEKNNIMPPVIGMNLRYFKPAHYDELLTMKTTIREIPHVRFEFKITNKKEEKVCTANYTLVFIEAINRIPTLVPEQIEEALKKNFKSVSS